MNLNREVLFIHSFNRFSPLVSLIPELGGAIPLSDHPKSEAAQRNFSQYLADEHTSCDLGRDGGQEGLYEYVKPSWMPKLCDLKVEVDLGKFGSAYNGDRPALPNAGTFQGVSVDHTYKLYYGGGQKRPDAMYSAIVRNAEGTPIAQVS